MTSTAADRAGTRERAHWSDLLAVVRTAGRLLWQYWPALLTLAFLGTGFRAGALWAAVEVSDVVPWLGHLILLFAPLGYLLPMVAMLYLCRRSLPNLQALSAQAGPEAPTERRERRLVDLAVSVLVPFLAVYVSYGLLDQDLARFKNEAAFREFTSGLDLSQTVTRDYVGRLGIYPWQIALMIVVVAWVLRWALGRIEKVTHFLALAFAGALLEVYYTGQLAAQSVVVNATGSEWLQSRRAVEWATERYDSTVGALGPLANPIDTATTWLFGLLGAVDAVVIVPVAWLTVGAVVLGHKLAPPERPTRERRYLDRVPGRVRTASGSLFADIASRWSGFWNGLRLLASAGLLPMLVFGLTFLVVIRIPTLFSELVRWAVGPMETSLWLAWAPMEGSLGLALSMVVTAPMLAAAIEWLVAPRVPTSTPDPAPADAIRV